MNSKKLQSVLTSLNKESFQHFIYELWKLDCVDTDVEVIELKKKPRIGEGIMEQKRISWESITGPKSQQAFNLVVPFFAPVDLLMSDYDARLFLSHELSSLRKYHNGVTRRLRQWYWPKDGQFNGPWIQFVSNISGFHKEFYLEKLLPKLTALVEHHKHFSGVEICTVDSLTENVPGKAATILSRLFSSHPIEMSFHILDGKVSVNQHITESYLKSGVLPGSLSPCDTVINIVPKPKIEIFKEFEALINASKKENELEQFITKYFQEIFGNHYDRIETQLWLKFPELDINKKNRRTDMFLRNAAESDWELVELKNATKSVVLTQDVPSISHTIQKSIAQIKNYERLLQQDSVKKKLAQQGIEYYEPQLRLVVGRKPDIPQEQWRRIKYENENGLKISTYDDLLHEMKYRYMNVIDFFTD